MIYEEKMKTGIEDAGKNDLITNRTILRLLENIGGYQSDKVGYGLLDIKRNGVSWILLDWKVQVLKRPKYGENLLVRTWGRNPKKVTVGRDYEIYNENNELCIIGTSKWALIDIESKKIAKITQEVIDKYEIEEQTVFEEEIDKVNIPNEFTTTFTFKPQRRNIDVNGHMHNTHYLELAYETLPEEGYQERPYNNFRISYKKEIKLEDTITCNYGYQDNKHIIVLKNQDNIVNSVIELWN
ncbi:MAG: hypothetical protein E7311_06880 [Clostridiales bacterium]|nr:hypothetical protein [Clostridiales bacterium]